MGSLKAKSTGTRRQWKIDGVFVDILGEIETAHAPNFRFLQTPEGEIQIMPAEEILIERIFVAYSNTPHSKRRCLPRKKCSGPPSP
jgi:hypothetical protein